jgi:hypothetical protein
MALVLVAGSQAANDLPDLLGLRRLDAALRSEAAIAAEDPSASAEKPFIMSPTSDEGDTAQATPAAASPLRQDMLTWFSEYTQHQVLFRNADMTRLRQALERAAEEQLERWAFDTQQLRQRLTSESWRITQQWLREFLAAQAIYSPGEISRWRQRMGTLTASQLTLVLDHFETVHVARLRSGQASEQLRVQQMSFASPLRPPMSTAGRAASFGPSSGFPSSVGTQFTRDRDRQYAISRRPTLSDRVANYYVNRAVFGRWWWWLW